MWKYEKGVQIGDPITGADAVPYVITLALQLFSSMCHNLAANPHHYYPQLFRDLPYVVMWMADMQNFSNKPILATCKECETM